MTPPPAAEVLVCIYYRVAAADAAHANALAREFQRGLLARMPALRAETLLRSELPTTVSLQGAVAQPEATLMETYRLPLPDAPAGAGADAAVRQFLHTLESAPPGLECLVRGTRHVELFIPCVS